MATLEISGVPGESRLAPERSRTAVHQEQPDCVPANWEQSPGVSLDKLIVAHGIRAKKKHEILSSSRHSAAEPVSTPPARDLDILFPCVVLRMHQAFAACFPKARKSPNQENVKMRNLFIAHAVLCATIVAFCPQPRQSSASQVSLVPLTHSPQVILCGPGLVYKCTPQGCFCVRP